MWTCVADMVSFGQLAAELPSVVSAALKVVLQHSRWLWEGADGNSTAGFGLRSHHVRSSITVYD